MKLKEFEIAFKKGLGRCFEILSKNSIKYESIIKKYATKCLSKDSFIEGTRAGYMYRIFSFYNKDEYLEEILKCFNKEKINSKSDFHYYVEILNIYASEEYEKADEALWNKYNYLYNKLLTKKSKPKNQFVDLEYFELLAIALSYSQENFVLIIKNIAELLQNIKVYSCKDFAWFFEMKEDFIEELSNFDDVPLVKYFLDIYLQYQYELFEKVKKVEPEERSMDDNLEMFSIYLAKQDENTIKDYAYKYVASKTEEEKIKYLKCFLHCEFPLLPDLIIEDCKSENEELSQLAYKVLGLVKHEDVKQFALQEIKQKNYKAYPLFIINYDYSDEQYIILKELLYEATEKEMEIIDSHIGLLIDIFDFWKNDIKPTDLLNILYENTFSSYTRSMIVDIMLENDCISKEIILECLNDCNSTIRLRIYNLLNEGDING